MYNSKHCMRAGCDDKIIYHLRSTDRDKGLWQKGEHLVCQSALGCYNYLLESLMVQQLVGSCETHVLYLGNRRLQVTVSHQRTT